MEPHQAEVQKATHALLEAQKKTKNLQDSTTSLASIRRQNNQDRLFKNVSTHQANNQSQAEVSIKQEKALLAAQNTKKAHHPGISSMQFESSSLPQIVKANQETRNSHHEPSLSNSISIRKSSHADATSMGLGGARLSNKAEVF